QWRKWAPLRRPLLRRYHHAVLHHYSRFQKCPLQFHHSLVLLPFRHSPHQHVLVDSVEKLFQIKIHDYPIARRYVPALVPPAEGATDPVEIHGCARRMSGPNAVAVPAVLPAEQIGPARRESINSSPLRPVWVSPPVSPASVCRSLPAVLPDVSASSSSGTWVVP